MNLTDIFAWVGRGWDVKLKLVKLHHQKVYCLNVCHCICQPFGFCSLHSAGDFSLAYGTI